MVIDVRIDHTSSLDHQMLKTIRELLAEAFDGHFDDNDWDHTLGGVHALARDGNGLVAHGAVVQRRLLHGGRALRAGYVEGVAVRADCRRRGYGGAVMRALDDVIRTAYEVGGLSAGDEPARLYRSLGWMRWQGRTWVLGPEGLARTPAEDKTTYVLPVTAELDLAGDLACDWRDGDVW